MASRIVLCDEGSAFRGRLQAALAAEDDIEIVGDVTEVAELQPLLAECPADVVVLDIDGAGGLPAVATVAEVAAETSVVVVSGCDEPELVQRVLQAGALGCVHRNAASDEMLRLLRRALDGMTAVTGDSALRMAESLRRQRHQDADRSQ
jgi:DNA-binding NarL/FixJ family response regulator